MTSRKKRKRDRRRAEATADSSTPKLIGGWGPHTDLVPGDLMLIRQADREEWSTDPLKLRKIYQELATMAIEDDTDARILVPIVRLLIDAELI